MFVFSKEINQEEEAAYACPLERTITDTETNRLIHFLMNGGSRNKENLIVDSTKSRNETSPLNHRLQSAYTKV